MDPGSIPGTSTGLFMYVEMAASSARTVRPSSSAGRPPDACPRAILPDGFLGSAIRYGANSSGWTADAS